jgi:hypothetical protein
MSKFRNRQNAIIHGNTCHGATEKSKNALVASKSITATKQKQKLAQFLVNKKQKMCKGTTHFSILDQ